MKVVITGATGFVGANLVRHFSNAGHEVIALGRQTSPPELLGKYARYVAADISKAVPEINGDICIHTAGLASDQSSYAALNAVNYIGTKNVFNSVACDHFIHISSASVYDNLKTWHIEDEPAREELLSDYGKSKRLAEYFLSRQSPSRRITILRPRAIYGVGDRVLLPRILNLVKMRRILVPGNLNIEVSLTHINNLVWVVEHCLRHPHSRGCQVYNVADHQVYHLRTVIQQLTYSVFGKHLPILAFPKATARRIAQLLSGLNIPSRLSVQGIDYVSNACVLDLNKVQHETGYKYMDDVALPSFYNSVDVLSRWVQDVGLKRILKGEKDLPWIRESCSYHSMYKK